MGISKADLMRKQLGIKKKEEEINEAAIIAGAAKAKAAKEAQKDKWSKGWNPPEGAQIPARMLHQGMHYYLATPDRVPGLLTQGYVQDEDLTNYYSSTNNMHVMDDTPLTTIAVKRGLVMMKMPKRLKKQRDEYYENINKQNTPGKVQKARLEAINEEHKGNIYGEITEG